MNDLQACIICQLSCAGCAADSRVSLFACVCLSPRNKCRTAISHPAAQECWRAARNEFYGRICVRVQKESSNLQLALVSRWEQMLQRCGLTPAVIKDRVLCAADNDFSIRTRTMHMQFDWWHVNGTGVGRGAAAMNVYGLCKNGSFNFITRARSLKLMVQRAL